MDDGRRCRPEFLWIQLINAEIVKVTGAMRRNQRWSIDQQPALPNLIDNTFLKLVAQREPSGLDHIIKFSENVKDEKSDLLGGYSLINCLKGLQS